LSLSIIETKDRIWLHSKSAAICNFYVTRRFFKTKLTLTLSTLQHTQKCTIQFIFIYPKTSQNMVNIMRKLYIMEKRAFAELVSNPLILIARQLARSANFADYTRWTAALCLQSQKNYTNITCARHNCGKWDAGELLRVMHRSTGRFNLVQYPGLYILTHFLIFVQYARQKRLFIRAC
jgi:hypothetical protein